MRNHTIQIGDRKGHSFKIHISTPSAWGQVKGYLAGDRQTHTLQVTGGPPSPMRVDEMLGNWRVLDKGFIRYDSGKVIWTETSEDNFTFEIYLLNLDGTWGIKLFQYETKFGGVNDEGAGFVIQPWVLGIDPGRFSWSLVD